MSEYRDGTARAVPPLVIRYSPFERTAPLWIVPWVIGIAWAVSRWPYAKHMWTMSPQEAETFEVARSVDKGKPFWHVGLRVSDGRHLAVTHLFRGRPDKHAAAVTRLNAWLEQLH